MTAWRSQSYRTCARADVPRTIVDHAVAIGIEITGVDPRLPPVFTLKHLAHLTDVDYGLLRAIVTRSLKDPYRIFRVRKSSSSVGHARYRVICVPDQSLMRVQRWITQNILAHGKPHEASVAYVKGATLLEATRPHCECQWLIKLDISHFFESVDEIAVYRAFREFKYQPLVAFELARICTRVATSQQMPMRWRPTRRWDGIHAYAQWRMGHLPQGAPTSPMLANLAVKKFDDAVSRISEAHGLVYTRYADDLVLSTRCGFSRSKCENVIRILYRTLGEFGFSPNLSKTRIGAPGARKVVLGLLVDRETPRLTREFKSRMRLHLYYLKHAQVGPVAHAKARGFTSVYGMRNHIYGLVSYARQIEPVYAKQIADKLDEVTWPV